MYGSVGAVIGPLSIFYGGIGGIFANYKCKNHCDVAFVVDAYMAIAYIDVGQNSGTVGITVSPLGAVATCTHESFGRFIYGHYGVDVASACTAYFHISYCEGLLRCAVR